MTENITFEFVPDDTFASDKETRVIRGLVVPTGSTAKNSGRTWQFENGSVSFARETTPLLQYHDTARPIGRLTNSEWTDRGLEAAFKVSKTAAGDEALELASDHVVGFSVGIEVSTDGAKQDGDVFRVTKASAYEVSIVPIPAFAASTIDSVAFSATTEDKTTTTPEEQITLEANLPNTEGPTPQPVPQATVIREESPYRFDGFEGGKHNFVQDAWNSARGDSEATNRLTKFLHQTFTVTGDVNELSPTGNRPELYVDSRPARRPLGSLVSLGGLSEITPFTVPKFNTAACQVIYPGNPQGSSGI